MSAGLLILLLHPPLQVKAGHLTQHEEDNFLRQITQLVVTAKKKDNKPHPSLSGVDDTQSSKSMPLLTSEHPPISPTPPPLQGPSDELHRKTSQQHEVGMWSSREPVGVASEGRSGVTAEIRDTPPTVLEEVTPPPLTSGSTTDLLSAQLRSPLELVSSGTSCRCSKSRASDKNQSWEMFTSP